jgi:2'-hydroxyisoflavone reductase
LVWMPTEALLAAGVDPWMGIPLWIGDPEWRAANLVDNSLAVAAGLTTRPVVETVADVASEVLSSNALPADDERRLLAGR